MHESVNDFLSRAASRCGFSRDSYTEKLVPASHDKISVIPFFGDLYGELVFSSLLYRRLLDAEPVGRYTIIATHPGRSFLYPEAAEVWGISGESVYDDLFAGADALKADSSRLSYIYQSLNRFFPKVNDMAVVDKWYARGLTGHYLDSFGKVLVDWPPVVGARPETVRQIGNRPGTKVFLAASKRVRMLDRGSKDTKVFVPKLFYVFLAERLMDSGFAPVFWNGPDCHDVSPELPGMTGVVTDKTLAGAVSAVRGCDCLLSIFNDLFSVAILARVPYLMVEERKRYFALNFFEMEDIMSSVSSIKPYFSFAGALSSNTHQETAKAIVNRLCEVRDKGLAHLGSNVSSGTVEADYGKVRRRRANKLGFRLFQPPKIED